MSSPHSTTSATGRSARWASSPAVAHVITMVRVSGSAVRNRSESGSSRADWLTTAMGSAGANPWERRIDCLAALSRTAR